MSTSHPFQDHLGIVAHPDHMSVEAAEHHTNATGTVQGGLIATLVDMAMASAVRASLEDDESAATLQLSVTYLNPAKPGETLIARAEIGKRGKSVLLLSAAVTTRDGRDISEAVGTFTITKSGKSG